MEAHHLSTKAARVGFDWKSVDDIFDKLHEEIEELRGAIKDHSAVKDEANHARVREEIGDLLFAATNIARHMQVEPEAALKLTNRKFRPCTIVDKRLMKRRLMNWKRSGRKPKEVSHG
jgi:ATP diphosphatase